MLYKIQEIEQYGWVVLVASRTMKIHFTIPLLHSDFPIDACIQ